MIGEVGGLAWHVYNIIGPEKGNDKLDLIRKAFGNDLCIELERNMFINSEYERFIIEYAKKNKLIIVAINETYSESQEDINVIEILQSISRKRLTHISKDNYFIDYKTMVSKFSDVIEAIENSTVISNMYNFHWIKNMFIYQHSI